MSVLRNLTTLGSALALSACASLGTNVSGSFDCKAPGGSCAPTAVIDQQASNALLDVKPNSGSRRSISGNGTARTRETLLKIIFPGFIDGNGNLHEARTVHVPAQKPDWTAAMTGDDSVKAIARRIARETKKPSHPNRYIDLKSIEDPSEGAIPLHPKSDHEAFDLQSFSLPSRAVNPLTVREAIAGLNEPAIEGFDMFPPWHERTPHSFKPPKNLPTIEAIEAAKKRASMEKSR